MLCPFYANISASPGLSKTLHVVRVVKTDPTDFALFSLEAVETLADAGPDARGVVLTHRETDRCGRQGDNALTNVTITSVH